MERGRAPRPIRISCSGEPFLVEIRVAPLRDYGPGFRQAPLGRRCPSFGAICGTVGSMGKALELAITKAAGLPEAAQEQVGRELLDRIEMLTQLRAEIDVGIRQLDAGLGEELDIEEFIEQLHAEYGRER
jgi:hypothetical protein